MTTAPVTYGTRLRHARRQKGLTQEQLADVLGTSRHRVLRWEKDLEQPWMYAEKLADYFDDESFIVHRDGKSELAAVSQRVEELTEMLRAALERLDGLEAALRAR